MKKIRIVLIAAFMAAFTSCNSDTASSNENKKDSSIVQSGESTKNETKTDNSGMSNDLMSSMNAMMSRMKDVKISGDFDIDFANMMIEHHQGAIDMSEKDLSAGQDDKMKEMAQKIISAQKDEIAKLRDFVKTYKPSGMKHGEGELNKTMSDVESKMKNIQMTNDIDKDFAAMMVIHHEGAVEMSKKETTNGMSSKLKQMAQKGRDEQSKEIKEFKDWLQSKK